MTERLEDEREGGEDGGEWAYVRIYITRSPECAGCDVGVSSLCGGESMLP